MKRTDSRHGERKPALHALAVLATVLAAALTLALVGCVRSPPPDAMVLRIYDWKTGSLHVEVPAQSTSRLFFGWVHSLENIPWNEYYHVDETYALVLDAITFPAFGAGIPEDKGRICYVKGGLIHMEGIDQVFKELVWLNSHTATRDILLDGAVVTRGSELPQHAILRLVIEKR